MFLGIIVGTVVGQFIGLLLPEGKVIRDVFVNSTDLHVGPLHVDLIVFSLTIGFSLHVNLMSAVGIFVVSLVLRWYW
jgi:Na+/H+-dicarboxylate symporter